MAAAGIVSSLLSMLSQPSSTQEGQTGMGSLFSFSEGGGAGGLVGGQGYASKDTYGSTGKAIASNIFDPGGLFRKGKKKDEPTMEELLDRMKAWERSQPEYIKYAGELEKLTPESGYGAIQPDWGDLLERSLRKTRQVYRGGPTTTGIYDKIKADLAARNISDSPALGRQMLMMGAQESQDIGDITSTFAEQERALKEAARLDTLNRLQSMAGYGTTAPNLSQLFALDAIQNPPPAQSTGGAGVGALLSNLLSKSSGSTSSLPQQYVPSSITDSKGKIDLGDFSLSKSNPYSYSYV